MPESKSNKKALLIIFGGLFLVTVGIVGGGWWFFKYKAPEYFRETQTAEQEARKAGASMTETACRDRAVAVLKSPGGHDFGPLIRNMITVKACLEASQPVANFCDDMPSPDKIFDLAVWEAKTCAALDEGSDHCHQLVGEVVKYCYSPQRAAKLSRPPDGTPPARPEKKAATQ